MKAHHLIINRIHKLGKRALIEFFLRNLIGLKKIKLTEAQEGDSMLIVKHIHLIIII